MIEKHLRVVLCLMVLLFLTAPALPAATVLYSTVPGALPPNMPSIGYEATSTAELGDLVRFAAGGGELTGATVVMSEWALASTYHSVEPGWFQDITLNLYQVDSSSGTAQPGALIDSVTQKFLIPWRPEASAGCDTKWRAQDGECYNGLAFTISFDLKDVRVPDEIIYGLAFNTSHRGYHPIGKDGPYNSLNFALSSVPPAVGVNPLPGTVYISGGGAYQQTSGFAQYSGAIEFTGVPEPGAMGLMASGLLLLVAGIGRRRG